MASRAERDERRSTRICAVVSACLLVVSSLPACTSATVPSARSTVHDQVMPVGQQIGVRSVPEPLVFGDEASKSLPVEQDEEQAGACSDALYIEEPMASGYVPVSVHEIEKICNDLQVSCFNKCYNRAPPKGKGWKKGDGDHYRYCHSMCFAQFMECRRKLGIVTRVFDAFDAAWAWIKDHKVAIVGTIIIVGGVAYIVSTGGSGALVLIPLGA